MTTPTSGCPRPDQAIQASGTITAPARLTTTAILRPGRPASRAVRAARPYGPAARMPHSRSGGLVLNTATAPANSVHTVSRMAAPRGLVAHARESGFRSRHRRARPCH